MPSFNGLSGTITSSVTGAVTFTVAPTAPSTFSGVLQNGAGTLAVTVNGGTAPQILSGVNTYSGPTTVSAGTLQIGNGSGGGGVLGGGTYTANISLAATNSLLV